jgi:hypothetical protein
MRAHRDAGGIITDLPNIRREDVDMESMTVFFVVSLRLVILSVKSSISGDLYILGARAHPCISFVS